MGPGVAQSLDGAVDHSAPLVLDAERTFADDFAELACRHMVLSRNFENPGKFCGRDGNDGACAAFAEENGFGGQRRILNGYDRGEMGRSMLRPGKRRLGSKAGFGEGYGEAAVGNIVRGLDSAFRGESDEAILETLLGGELDDRKFAGDDAGDSFGVFGRGEFAGEYRRLVAKLGCSMLHPYNGRRSVEEEDEVALITESNLEDARDVVENAENADDRRRVDRLAERLVVKANVATGDRRAESVASFGEAGDGLRKLPHHFGLFGTPKIEAIRGGDGTRAARGHIAGGFRDGVHGANARMELAPAAVAVGRERQGALHGTGLGILDAHDRGIARAGGR